ncbi:MAG: division/cell wall cluster transcriptional repressor MraZ [Bacillota bacterium]|nr:division/cell wall cluster transcriptional repressor MraZ [Bacillota bacterium]
MFYGEKQHKIDKMGRVSVPSKFRQKISQSIIVTKGDELCLLAYPMEEWQEYDAKLKALPGSDKIAQAYIREIYSYAEECFVDSQGRIKLTEKLMDYAKIQDEVVFIGKPGKFEMWSNHVLDAYRAENPINSQEMAEHMARLGI